MKMYAIAWDISSTDGERVLSIWTSHEKAENEISDLRQKNPITYRETRIVEFEADTHNGLEDALC